MTNEQLQQFFIQQAAAAAAAAAVFSSLWNGQQPPNASQHMAGAGQPNNQQVQSQQGDDRHDLTSSATNTGNNNTSLSLTASQQQTLNTQNPLEALLANAGSPVNLAALMQNFQKQQQDSTNSSSAASLASCFNMPDQQRALAAALRSSSSHSANNSANAAALNALPSLLQHQLNNLISPPSNHSQNNNNNHQQSSNKQLNNSGSASSSPSSLTNHHQQQQPTTTTNKSQQSTAYHHYQNSANTRSSGNSKSISGNNQAINNQQTSHSNNANTTNISSSLDGGKIEVGLNMTTTALSSSTTNQMQSSHAHGRAISSPVTNIQAPINVASQQHHKTSSSSSHHHQSSHKQSVSTNSPREPISSTVLAKNNVGLPRKLVRGQDVWLGRGVEQTRQILKCMWCGQSCRTLADLSQHMKETQHYTNIVSQEQITSWRTPDNDLTQSQVNQVFTCKVCDEAFSSLNELSNHMVKKSHYNGQPMSSPIGNYSLVGGESNSAHMINQQHLLNTTTNRKSPSLIIPDMQSVGQVSSHKKQRNSSSFYNEYDQSASPQMTSNSTKERRKKSLPVRKLLELERKGSTTVGRQNQSKNDLIPNDNISGLTNQDSDCDDNGRENSSMALMSRMLDRQETNLAYNDNDHLGMSDDETSQYRDDANSGNKIYGAHNSDNKAKKRHNDFDDDGDDSSGILDRSPRGRSGQSQLSPGMSDHESMHSSTSASYRNQIHIDTTNLTPHCADCHNNQKKSSCRQKCRSCSNPQPLTTGSTLYKPGTVGRQLLASLMNNKLDPDQLDEDLLNRPLMYDSNGDVVINLEGRLTSAQTKSEPDSESPTKSSKNSDDPDKHCNSKVEETGDESTKRESDEKDQQDTANIIKTEKNDDNKGSQIDASDSGKSVTFQDNKVTRPQTLSAASPSDKNSGKGKMFSSNTSSLSALEMLVEKSFDPKTRRGAQNTGILQRLGIDEEICPPWQHMNYASWYAAAAASYGGIQGNPMAAMSGLSGYPLTSGMPMSMGSLGNVANSSRSQNNITPLSGQGASMTSPMRTPSSSPPTNTSSPHSSGHQHSSHNKSLRSMSLNPSINNLQIEASSSPSLNSLMATTHQQLQSLASSSMQYQSPHSSPTAASLGSTKGAASANAGRNSKRSFQTMQNELDFNDSPPKPASQDNSSPQASRRTAPSSSSRNNSSIKGSKRGKFNDESSANNSSQTATGNRYPRRSKTSTTLNKLKQQLESESEEDFEDYDNEQEPVSLAMKKSTKSDTTVSSVHQQDFQQEPLQQLQQLQLQLQQQQQLPREDVDQQSLAAMQATFLLKQLMTQAVASMVTGNHVQPTPDNLASVQQYLLGSMLNQNQNQTQPKQTHADSIQQSKKKSARRSFSDDIDEDDKEGLSDDGDCVDFTSSANVQQQYKQQQNKSSSRGRKSTKKAASRKSSSTKRNTQATSSSSAIIASQQHESDQLDISNTEEVPVEHDEKYTVASSEEQDLVDADHSSSQEKSKSISRRRQQNSKKDNDNSEIDDHDGGDDDADDDVKDNASGQSQITGQDDHLDRVLHDEQEEVADSDNQSSRKSIIGKINVDNDLNDSTATESTANKKKKNEEGDQLLLCDDRAEDHDELNGKKDGDDNIDQDKNNRHHEKSIGGTTKTVSNQKQTVVSRIDDAEEEEAETAAAEKEEKNILEPLNTGNNDCESTKIPLSAAYEISDGHMADEEQQQTSNSTGALPSQEITENISDDERNTDNEDAAKEINTDQSNKLGISAELASVDDVSQANKLMSEIVDDHNSSSHCGLSSINHDDLTSSDEDNEDYSGNYMASASLELDQNRSSKNRHNQQQQTVLGQVGKTNGDTKSVLEVKP